MAKRKALGSNQERIVLFLAENPRKTMSEMQKEFDIPKNSYNLIHNATKALEEIGYVVKGEAVSEKKRPTFPITLTEKGVLYVLSKLSNSKKQKVLKIYASIYPSFVKYQELSEELGDKLAPKLFNHLFSSLQISDNNRNKKEKLDIAFALAEIFSNNFSDEDRNQIVRAAFKVYPEFKEMYRSLMQNLMSEFDLGDSK